MVPRGRVRIPQSLAIRRIMARSSVGIGGHNPPGTSTARRFLIVQVTANVRRNPEYPPREMISQYPDRLTETLGKSRRMGPLTP